MLNKEELGRLLNGGVIYSTFSYMYLSIKFKMFEASSNACIIFLPRVTRNLLVKSRTQDTTADNINNFC